MVHMLSVKVLFKHETPFPTTNFVIIPQSYDLLATVWNVRDKIPSWLAAIYLIGNPTLNLLNIFWCVALPAVDWAYMAFYR